MNGYNDYQNYLLNQVAYFDLTAEYVNSNPPTSLYEALAANSEYKEWAEKIQGAGIGDLIIKDYANNNNNNKQGSRSGFCAIALKDPKTNSVAISYRGTEGLDELTSANQADMVDNINTALLGTSSQKNEAIKFFEKNRSASGENYLFGHSKGGELASEVYAKYYNSIKRMTIYNPQPINDKKFSNKQKDAFKSDKVDVVIIDGDTVSSLGRKSVFGNRIRFGKNNGKDDSFFGPHLLKAATFKDNNIVIEENPYSNYPDQLAFCLLAERLVSDAQVGKLPTLSFLVLVVANTYDFIVNDVPQAIEILEKAVDLYLEGIEEIKEVLFDVKIKINQFITNVKKNIKDWINKTFGINQSGNSLNEPYIRANTASLRDYADRLTKVNQQLVEIDRRMDALYTKVGWRDLWNLIQVDVKTGYNGRIKNCAKYLNETADDLDSTERRVISIFEGV